MIDGELVKKFQLEWASEEELKHWCTLLDQLIGHSIADASEDVGVIIPITSLINLRENIQRLMTGVDRGL